MGEVQVFGLLGLIVLIADVYAIIRIAGSGARLGSKIGWILLILFLPLVGLMIWAFFGPERPAIA